MAHRETSATSPVKGVSQPMAIGTITDGNNENSQPVATELAQMIPEATNSN